MAKTPASGQISFSQIQGALGGSNPIAMSEYYGYDAQLPGSGTIWTSQFYNLPHDIVYNSGTYTGVGFTITSPVYSILGRTNLSVTMYAVQNTGPEPHNGAALYLYLNGGLYSTLYSNGMDGNKRDWSAMSYINPSIGVGGYSTIQLIMNMYVEPPADNSGYGYLNFTVS
jgi:hypothetical protein